MSDEIPCLEKLKEGWTGGIKRGKHLRKDWRMKRICDVTITGRVRDFKTKLVCIRMESEDTTEKKKKLGEHKKRQRDGTWCYNRPDVISPYREDF